MEAWGRKPEPDFGGSRLFGGVEGSMRDPRWKDQFDLAALAIFECCLIGPQCSALNWEHVQQLLGMDVPFPTVFRRQV